MILINTIAVISVLSNGSVIDGSKVAPPQSAPVYTVVVKRANFPSDPGTPVNGRDQAINKSDALVVTVNSSQAAAYLASKGVKVSAQLDNVATQNIALVSRLAASLATQTHSVAVERRQSPSGLLSLDASRIPEDTIRRIEQAIRSKSASEASLTATGEGTPGATARALSGSDISAAKMFLAGASGQGKVDADLFAARLSDLQNSVKQFDFDVQVVVTGSRPNETNRVVDVNPLSVLGQENSKAVQDVIAAAQAAAKAFDDQKAKIGSLGTDFQKIIAALKTDLATPPMGTGLEDFLAKVQALTTLVDGLAAKYPDLATAATQFEKTGTDDLNQLLTAIQNLETAYKQAESGAQMTAKMWFDKVEKDAANASSTLAAVKGILDYLSQLQPVFQQIASQTFLGAADQPITTYDGSGALGGVALQAEDELTLVVNAKPKGDPDSNYKSIGNSTTVTVFPGPYWTSTTLGIFPSYNHGSSFKIGGGQFASWHPLVTRSSILRTSLGLALGVGMTPSGVNDSLGTSIMAGVSLYRDSFQVGVGRNLGSSTNFVYFGLRVIPSFLNK